MSDRPSLFRTKRFAFEAATTVALMLGFFALGFWVASLILANLPESDTIQWVVTDPGDPFAAKVKLGLFTALAPLVSLVALVLHRLGGRAHPGWRPTLLLVALPIAVVAVGVGVQVNALHTLTRVGGDAPYLVALRDVLPGVTTKALLAITALVLWGAAFAASRAARKAKG